MIGAGVHIYVYILYIQIYMFVDGKKIESYFSNRLIFSNIRSRTSHQIYRLALPLCTPETLSSTLELSLERIIAIGRQDQ